MLESMREKSHRCHMCKLVKPATEFYLTTTPTGKPCRMLSNGCIPCNKNKALERLIRFQIRKVGVEAYRVRLERDKEVVRIKEKILREATP